MSTTPTTTIALETATLAGGCFWCLEAVFADLEGIEQITSGYMGGAADHPTYEAVCDGGTGHAEVVQLAFDPAVLSYRTVLEVFFAIHDPTTPDRQGNDVGSQYRSAVFWHDERQRAEAARLIAELTRDGVFPAPIVTELAPAAAFWPAEGYHRDYYARHPDQPYCRHVVSPKLTKFRARFAERLKPSGG